VKVKSRKFALITGAFLIAIMASGALIGILNLLAQNAEAFTPHYLTYMEAPSKIYIASATTTNIIADQTYHLADGQEVPKGNELLQLKVDLRNDYTSDTPPPSKGTPVSPVDGTAYICLSITLYNKNGAVTANILSPSDFSVPSPDEIGLVLASRQTNSVNINLGANPADISRFEVNLVFVGDSILS
jgi:hypothetical protein